MKSQPPFNLEWYSIKTPHYRIVFHDGLQDKALETAAIMDHVWEIVPDIYSVKPAPISLYLNSLTTTPNACVTLAPHHMHYYLHPPQNANMLGSADWEICFLITEMGKRQAIPKLSNPMAWICCLIFTFSGSRPKSIWVSAL